MINIFISLWTLILFVANALNSSTLKRHFSWENLHNKDIVYCLQAIISNIFCLPQGCFRLTTASSYSLNHVTNMYPNKMISILDTQIYPQWTTIQIYVKCFHVWLSVVCKGNHESTLYLYRLLMILITAGKVYAIQLSLRINTCTTAKPQLFRDANCTESWTLALFKVMCCGKCGCCGGWRETWLSLLTSLTATLLRVLWDMEVTDHSHSLSLNEQLCIIPLLKDNITYNVT